VQQRIITRSVIYRAAALRTTACIICGAARSAQLSRGGAAALRIIASARHRSIVASRTQHRRLMREIEKQRLRGASSFNIGIGAKAGVASARWQRRRRPASKASSAAKAISARRHRHQQRGENIERQRRHQSGILRALSIILARGGAWRKAIGINI